MSKRTEWFNAYKQPPVNGDANSKYEWRCRSVTRKRSLLWLKTMSCPNCQWRGLTRPAEE